jgi:hypothetical protein
VRIVTGCGFREGAHFQSRSVLYFAPSTLSSSIDWHEFLGNDIVGLIPFPFYPTNFLREVEHSRVDRSSRSHPFSILSRASPHQDSSNGCQSGYGSPATWIDNRSFATRSRSLILVLKGFNIIKDLDCLGGDRVGRNLLNICIVATCPP